MEVDNLIIEYLKVKKIKQDAIHMQKYELAANSRDDERQLSVKIFNILHPNDSYGSYNNFDKIIDEYCLEKYNVSIHSDICLKSVIRSKKLNDLGI
jgi:hypothetical protein